jgi:hypothetical protein
MAAKKKKVKKKAAPKSVQARVETHRQRMTKAGMRQLSIWLPAGTVARLDELCEQSETSRQQVIAYLVDSAG